MDTPEEIILDISILPIIVHRICTARSNLIFCVVICAARYKFPAGTGSNTCVNWCTVSSWVCIPYIRIIRSILCSALQRWDDQICVTTRTKYYAHLSTSLSVYSKLCVYALALIAENDEIAQTAAIMVITVLLTLLFFVFIIENLLLLFIICLNFICNLLQQSQNFNKLNNVTIIQLSCD